MLAQTVVGDDGSETREYPYGEVFAHVIGYSNSKLGTTGLESVENFELLTSNAFFLEKLQNEFSEKKNRGDTVVTHWMQICSRRLMMRWIKQRCGNRNGGEYGKDSRHGFQTGI